MKKRVHKVFRQAKQDFTRNNLPHNRKEVFATLFKIRFGMLCKISLMVFVFCIPLFGFDIYARYAIRATQLSGLENGLDVEQIKTTTFMMFNTKNLINIPLFMIAGLGFGGAIHLLQKLVWNEIVFFGDFFEDYKKSWWKYMSFGGVIGFSSLAFQFLFYSIPTFHLNAFSNMLLYGIAIIQLILVSIIIGFCFMQNEYYKTNIVMMLSNAFKFTIKTFVQSLGFLLIVVAGYSFILFDNFLFDFLAPLLFLLTVVTGLLLFILHSDYQFDRWINKENYQEIYDRGVYRNIE